MAYTPINWQTGDTITAEKMNKMDNGWGVQSTQLFSETVTTEDTGDGYAVCDLTYSSYIDADSIIVTLNSTDYTCPRIVFGSRSFYGGFNGGPDFTTYPFFLYSESGGVNQLITSTAGTYSLSVSASVLEVSDNFVNATKTAIGGEAALTMLCVDGSTTADEMQSAQDRGQLLYFYSGPVCHMVSSFISTESDTAVTALPEGTENVETYGFQDDGDGNLIFTIFFY